MTLEYITLGLYLLALPFLGLLFSKLNTNLSDFVRGGGQGTWWLVGTRILMSHTSAFTFTGNASAAFEAGPTVLVIYAANVVALLIGAWFLGAWFRQTRAYTKTDVVRQRFGVLVEQFNAYTMVVLSPFAAAIQLWALAVFANSIFGFPLQGSIIVIGLIVIFYSTTGGKWAVMATDFMQSLIMISITLLVAVLAIIKIGGFGEFFSFFSQPEFARDFAFVKEPGAFPTDRFSLKWIFVIFFMSIYAQISLNGADRYLAVRDGIGARKAALLAAVLMAVGSVIWFIPPMVARFLYGDAIMAQDVANPANTSYAFIARELLPNGMMGVMIAAMFAATMSAMDTGLNVQVGVLARNIVPPLRRFFGRTEEMAPKTEVLMCKGLTLGLGVVIITYSILFSLNKELILFDAYLTVNSIIGIPLVFPLLIGMWVRKIPSWSYFSIFGFCMIPSLYSLYMNLMHDVSHTIQDRALWIFVFGFIGTLVSVPFYKRSPAAYKEQVNDFFVRMHTPIDFIKEVGVSRTHSQLIILGWVSVATGFVLSLLLLVPNTLWARVGVFSVAGFSAFIGVLLLIGAKAEKRREDALIARLEAEGVEHKD